MDSKLARLQRDQQAHDSRSHKDILCLRLPEKMTHFTFHLAKYCGRLSQPETRLANLHSTAVDVFVIALAMSNALGMDIDQFMDQLPVSLVTTGRIGEENRNRISLAEQYFCELVKSTGQMAKACEGLDHLEPIAYRDIFTLAATELCQTTVDLYTKFDWNLEAAVRLRWATIEDRV
jgi:hypothetical protein